MQTDMIHSRYIFKSKIILLSIVQALFVVLVD